MPPIVPLAQPISEDRRRLWHGQVEKGPEVVRPPADVVRPVVEPRVGTPPPPPPPATAEQVDQQSQKVERLRQSRQEADSYTQMLKQRLQEKQNQLDQSVEKNRQLKTKVQELTAQKKAAESLAQNLRQSAENLQQEQGTKVSPEEVQKLQNRVQEKESQSRQLEQKITQLQEQLQGEESLRNHIRDLQSQVQQLSQEKQGLEQALREEEQQLADLQQRYDQLKIEDRQHGARLAKLEEVVAASIQKPTPKPLPPEKIKRVAQPSTTPTAGEKPRLTQLPNAINGFVYDANGEPISGAIVMIKDVADNNLRALQTQELGQFLISTPLPNGTYRIVTEKDELDFDILEITLEGAAVPPLEIRAHGH